MLRAVLCLVGGSFTFRGAEVVLAVLVPSEARTKEGGGLVHRTETRMNCINPKSKRRTSSSLLSCSDVASSAPTFLSRIKRAVPTRSIVSSNNTVPSAFVSWKVDAVRSRVNERPHNPEIRRVRYFDKVSRAYQCRQAADNGIVNVSTLTAVRHPPLLQKGLHGCLMAMFNSMSEGGPVSTTPALVKTSTRPKRSHAPPGWPRIEPGHPRAVGHDASIPIY